MTQYESGAQDRAQEYSAVPDELVVRHQWAAWRYEHNPTKGKDDKVPYTPGTQIPARSNKRQTWGTFTEAVATEGMRGVGYMLSADDPYVGIDLDGCRDPQTGDVALWARAIIDEFNTFTEVSPSGTGIKLWLKAHKSAHHCKVRLGSGVAIEVYERTRFFTVTGQHLDGTPRTIEPRQAQFDLWYRQTFAAQLDADASAAERRCTNTAASHSDMTDDEVIELAGQGTNAERFLRLWDGDVSKYHGDESMADMALCGMLAFYTGNDSDQMVRLVRRSGLYRPKWERADYRQRTLEQAIRNTASVYSGPGRQRQARQVRRMQYVYEWQRHVETPQQRNLLLAQAADKAKDRVRQHFASEEFRSLPLVIALPPGTGKSHVIAALGKDFDVAWISERHSMRESVPALTTYYRPIQGCSEDNCPEYRKHAALVAKGRNTWPLHQAHRCEYSRQHEEEGSAVYQIAHVQTNYPQRHDAIVTDELNLSNWLPSRPIGHGAIQSVLVSDAANNPAVTRLMRALREVLTLAERNRAPLHGRALFAALDHELDGELAELVEDLGCIVAWMETRPREPVSLSLAEIEALPPVVVPYLLRALQDELPRWRGSTEWNSRMRVSHGEHGWALYVIELRRFTTPEEAPTKPLVILDATANEELLERLLGTPVTLVRHEVEPPPHMQHIAVRTGKRYTKFSLTEAKHSEAERMRVVRELRYILTELSVTEAMCKEGEVGLITFQGAKDRLGEALGIPPERRGHFWGVRGSNALAKCRILLVVGTPTANLSALESEARALYRDDPKPLDTETVRDERGRRRYGDERLRGYADYMTNAELTQCAHRNRPLRFDGRVVVTLCEGEVDFLPVTQTYLSFPQLNEDGTLHADTKRQQDDARLSAAYEQLMARHGKVSVRALDEEMRAMFGTGLSTATISAWLRAGRAGDSRGYVAESA